MRQDTRKLYQYDLINENILFVDGLTRVGKTALNQLISGITGVSHPQVFELLEQICPMVLEGEITKEGASALIRLQLNERAYNYELSRNLNFRKTDLTSVHNSQHPEDFFKKLDLVDGDQVLKSRKEVIHQFLTHDLLVNFEVIRSLRLPFKMVEVYRNPIETIHSWHSRGWGYRFDQADLRSFTTLFETDNKVVPHYFLGLKENYFECNEVEKCVLMHNHLIRKSISEFDKLGKKEKERIYLVCYEDVLSSPLPMVSKIANFLGCEPSNQMDRYLKIADLPRKQKKAMLAQKREVVFNAIRPHIAKDLREVEALYFDQRYFYGTT